MPSDPVSVIRAVSLGAGAYAPTMSEGDVAKRLGRDTDALARYRRYGIGPVALLVDDAWKYFADSVAAWIDASAPSDVA